jgi:hypothetical protein
MFNSTQNFSDNRKKNSLKKFVFNQGFVATAEFRCTPNETYQDDCNTCKCNESGSNGVCTQRACYHGPMYEDTVTTQSTTDDDTISSTEVASHTNQVCTPNEIKMEVREQAKIVVDFNYGSESMFIFFRIAIDVNAPTMELDGFVRENCVRNLRNVSRLILPLMRLASVAYRMKYSRTIAIHARVMLLDNWPGVL